MSDWDVESGEPARAWRLRPVILAVIGAAAAILVQQLIDRPYGYSRPPLENWRIAVSIAIGTGAMAFGFGMERVRLVWAAGFALMVGAVAGLIFYWNGGNDGWGDIGDWRYASLFLASAIAVPLFQTARDEGAWRFPYRDVHGHAWTNVVLWFACWMFVGVVFAMAWLLAALFDLIGLHLVREMLERHWFAAGLAGAAFGGALGLFRERDRIVRLLQRVVTAVLAVLAPVLGAGLLLFLLALPFTGLGALWLATKATTPILLCCAIGALILANAVIGNGEDEEATNPVLRWGAMALGLAILPICVIAAIATGLRIGQYGFTPDRLWALAFVILATAYGVAYFVSLVRGRQSWAAKVRPANLYLAFIVTGVALFLATPLLSFNAISTRDQVSRLESGRIAADKFDWAALAFDFGDPGKAALKKLQASPRATIKALADNAATATTRWDVGDTEKARTRDEIAARLRRVPQGSVLPPGLGRLIADQQDCPGDSNCTVVMMSDAEAILYNDACFGAAAGRGGKITYATVSGCAGGERFKLADGTWQRAHAPDISDKTEAERAAALAGYKSGKIEIRTVPRRQVFVGDVPVGEPFE